MGKSATWEMGRRLTSFNGHTFTYDAQGRRLTKDNISFTYDSKGRLVRQSNGLDFFYDHTGIAGFRYESKVYAYRKNAQGDIIAILDSTGRVVIKYHYDAWGNVMSILLEPTLEALVSLNPFRYRSYYYDGETNLYYLNTRYYDPTIGRFITIDSIEYLDPETINGLNLYAYCLNNPVMYSDPTGHFGIVTMALIGIVASGLISGTINAITKSYEESILGSFVGGFFEGVVSATTLAIGIAIGTTTGGACYAILGGIVAIIGGFVGGKYGNAISQQISYGNVDWGITNVNGSISALMNLVSYVGLSVNKNVLSFASKGITRFLENVKPSIIGLSVSTYFGTLPKPNLNSYRNIKRIKSQEGRFIWDYLF